MAAQYPILELPVGIDGSGQGSEESSAIDTEQMGSKEKFWVTSAATGERLALFKFARDNTGEDWAEVIASVVADHMMLPHAKVLLARYADRRGALVLDFVPDGESLVHGNELLFDFDPNYPKTQTHHASQYTVSASLSVLETNNVLLPTGSLPAGVTDAPGVFIGYLLLDAIIGNTDRHHENWGVLLRHTADNSRTARLAPTYDHASSLGRELLDEARSRRLAGAGSRGVAGYGDGGRSAFRLIPGAQKALPLLDALLEAGKSRPNALRGWVEHCETIGFDRLAQAITPVPTSIMSDTAKDFARALMRYNYQQIVAKVLP